VKGLILSGGAGTRLRPITHTNAKQLVPIANKPILFYGIESLVEAGIKEIGIIIGETGEEVRQIVGDGSLWGVNITYIPQEAPLGLAHCVLIAEDFLGDDNFVMYLGDNMLERKIEELVLDFESVYSSDSLACRILLKEVENPSTFGVATIDHDGHVKELVEKPSEPKSNLALVGIYFFTPMIHQAVKAITPSKREELEITDAIQWLIEQEFTVDHEILTGWWIDTGKKDPLLECNKLVLDTIKEKIDETVLIDNHSEIIGDIQIEESSLIRGSKIIGPAVIGKNVVIEDCTIGPYVSIGDNCSVISSSVDNSVLLSGCKIDKTGRLTSSLLGCSSIVKGNSSTTSTLMLGDDSTVELL
tara:strand:- start:12062 stop:13138 length:1077 start_codon:yes stop_codon:yes gene_type:complete